MPAILCLVALVAGCSAGPEAPPTPVPSADSRTEDWTLAPRGSRELNMNMTEGATIDFTLVADATIQWDLHSHEADRSVVTHASGEGLEGAGTFTAPTEGVYSIYARAGTVTAHVIVKVEGDFEVLE